MLTEPKDFNQIYCNARKHTLVSKDRCKILYDAAVMCNALDGLWFECGVYKGGTAMLLSELITDNELHLFDTFQGMPPVNPKKDIHKVGDFKDVSYEEIQEMLPPEPGKIVYHKGLIPDTFKGLEQSRIALAHIDVDIYQSVLDCCKFIYPRLLVGGAMILDDYGFDSCPGAKAAADEFFSDKPEEIQLLETRQAVIIKG